MSWASPLTSESDLIELFRELGEPYRQALFRYAWNLAYPDHFLGGPMHGKPIDEIHWSGDDDPSEIAVAYDECRHAIYLHARHVYPIEGLGIYVFKSLRKIDPSKEKGGAA